MNFFYLVFGVFTVLGYAQSHNNTHFVIGGFNTKIEKYPFIVQVEYYEIILTDWRPNCAANILSSSWLLSAAHCYQETNYSSNNSRIRAGTTHLEDGGVIYYVDFIRNHPDYGKAAKYDADISCLKLVTPLVFNDVIKPVHVNVIYNMLQPDAEVQYVGWGDLFVGSGEHSYVLQHVTVHIVNNTQCAERYKREYGSDVITKNMICAGVWGLGGKDACTGDSGGPLYTNGVLYGIVSWGHFCARENFPGISTDVAVYADWISNTTEVNRELTS